MRIGEAKEKRIRLLTTLGVVIFSAVMTTVPLAAAVINFDDIDASAGDVILDTLSPYHGYNWMNFSVYTTVPGFPGFNNTIVSAPNAAYSSGVGQITAAAPFDLGSLYLGSGYYNNLSVTIQGLLGGTQYYSQTVTVGTTGAQAFSLGFAGIDTLIFSAFSTAATTDPYNCGPIGCTYFTLDDISLSPSVTTPPPPPPPMMDVPEPASLSILALGTLVLLSFRRFRRSAQ